MRIQSEVGHPATVIVERGINERVVCVECKVPAPGEAGARVGGGPNSNRSSAHPPCINQHVVLPVPLCTCYLHPTQYDLHKFMYRTVKPYRVILILVRL